MRRALAVLLLVLAACGGGDTGGADGPPLPTPQTSYSPAIAGTVSLLRDALAAIGGQLFPPVAPYRPSEPASLSEARRAVLQVQSADPNQGYVLVYELLDSAAATTEGQELASYLGSGFGQTNFPFDSQFSVAQVGSTIVFTWWSADRASDRDAARAAFEAIASVGQPIPVIK
jgi:hypothetical protein